MYQSELAQDYFNLHGLDGDEDLLERTVKSYEDYLKLTQDRYASGVASGGDLALAETQLYTTTAQLVDLNVMRTQYEHAIAMLTGKPPSAPRIPRKILRNAPPVIPVALPSALLERRPDIASHRAPDGRRQRADRNRPSRLLSHYLFKRLRRTPGLQPFESVLLARALLVRRTAALGNPLRCGPSPWRSARRPKTPSMPPWPTTA